MSNIFRRTWCEIDLDALLFNLHQIRHKIGPKRIIAAVLKADGYGHGSLPIAKLLENIPKLYFAVATPDEAILLRKSIPKKPIMVLSCLQENEIESVFESGFIPNIVDYNVAKKLDRLAKKYKCKLKIQIELDTGIGRIGPWYSNALDLIQKIAGLDNLILEGLYTHFASAEIDKEYTQLQINRFQSVNNELKKRKIKIKFKHTANSASIIAHPKSYFDMVRPGLILYGLYPAQWMKKEIRLKQVMSLKAIIIYLKKVQSDFSISYGRTYITRRASHIATVSLGYRNGYSRLSSNCGYGLLHGGKVPIIGRVCMDQLMLDVTDISNVKLGDEIVFLGQQKKAFISMDEISNWSNTINYESACTLGSMNHRIYKKTPAFRQSGDNFLSRTSLAAFN